MESKEVDFGDLISAVIESNAVKLKAEREAQAEKEATAAKMLRDALRPLITVFRQAKDRFPRASIHGLEYGYPHIYTSGNIWVTAEYNPTTGLFSLVRRGSGYGTSFGPTTDFSSLHAEDLIPPLIDILAKAVLR